jgi:hypothetical protein
VADQNNWPILRINDLPRRGSITLQGQRRVLDGWAYLRP